jgi:predicted MFS family arabinose efflux permease
MTDAAPPLAAMTEAARLRHGWFVAGVMFLALLLVFGARFSMGLFLPFLPEALGASPADVSAAIAMSLLGAGVMQPMIGALSDAIGPRRVLIAGLGSAGALYCAMPATGSVWALGAIMFVFGGFAFAAVSPVLATALMVRWFDRQRGRALGFVTAGTKVAMLTLVPAISVGIALAGWQATVVALGVVIWSLLPVVVLRMRAEPPPPDAAPQPAASLRGALGMRAFWLISAALFANGFVMNLVFVHLPSFILERGHGTAAAAAGLSIVGAVGIAGNILIGSMSDRLSRRGVLSLVFAARIAALAAVVMLPGPGPLVLFVVVFGLLGYGALVVVGGLVAEVFGQKSFGAILGMAYVLNQIGGAAGIWAGGLSAERAGSYDAALILAVAVSVVALGAMALLPARPRGQA